MVPPPPPKKKRGGSTALFFISCLILCCTHAHALLPFSHPPVETFTFLPEVQVEAVGQEGELGHGQHALVHGAGAEQEGLLIRWGGGGGKG